MKPKPIVLAMEVPMSLPVEIANDDAVVLLARQWLMATGALTLGQLDEYAPKLAAEIEAYVARRIYESQRRTR